MTKKRIAFVLGGMGRGGAEKVISILSNYYVNTGWDVDILMLLNNKVEYELDKRINLVDFSNKDKSRWLMFPNWIKNIRKYIKQQKPAIVVSFAARINIITIFAKMLMDVPLIISERNDPKADTRGLLAKVLIPFIYPKADKIVFQTEYAQSCFNNRIKALGTVIYNPVSIGGKAQEIKLKKIVNVGRLNIQKNQKMLIFAFSVISKLHPDYRLHIYGEGALRDSLSQQISELKLNERIILEGNVSNVHERISDAEIFVLSSNFEGLSNALLEAMAMGLSCISTKCAGATELIIDGQNGLLIDVGDEAELVKAMLKLIENKNYAYQLGNEAKKIVELVGKDEIVKKWDELIIATIGERK